MHDRMMIDGKGATAEEWALIGHTRGWCHDTTACALCKVERSRDSWRAVAESSVHVWQ